VGGEFAAPRGLAVDNSGVTPGDVYAINQPNLQQFNAKGEPLSSFVLPEGSSAEGYPAWEAVDSSGDATKGDIYVGYFSSGKVRKFEPSGALVAGFGVGGVLATGGGTAGVGVDPANGHLFVLARETGLVTEYESSGSPVAGGSFPVSGNDGLAVDAKGNVFVVNEGVEVTEYPASNRLTPKVIDNGNSPFEVAVDTSTGDVYVFENATGEIAVYEPEASGEYKRIVSFASGASGSSGMGVNATTHTVYVMNPAAGDGVILEEGEAPEAPATTAASEVKGTTALLPGRVNPVKAATVGYHFAYNTGSSCENGPTTTPGAVTEAEGANVAVSTEAKGLSPRTEYTFCLVATNPFGVAFGLPQTFTTTAAQPVIETESSPEVTIATAKIEATINPSGAETTCEVEYGVKPLTEAPGAIVACPAALGEGLAGVGVTVVLAGLSEGTVYHYRMIASNALSPAGGTPGPEQSFQTLIRPGIVEQSAAVLSAQAVVLSAMVNTYGNDTTYHFVYGPGEGYGSSFPASDIDLVASNENLKAQVELSGLQPGTTYHYALVAHNVGGTRIGPDQTFTTPPATLPAVTAPTAGEVFQNGASISGTVDPGGLQTFYEFDLGTDTSYGARVFGNAGSGAGPVTVTTSLQNLAAGTTYHYRLLATNIYGTTYGPDQTFTTPAYPTATLTAPPTPVLIPIPTVVFPAGEPVAAAAKASGAKAGSTKAGSASKKKPKRKTRGKAGKAARRAGRPHANNGRGK
jgi:hypothetical protein